MRKRPWRILTAVAAYDGHDASILALNRALLRSADAVEVVYLGFNMRGEHIASAAVQEGADAVAVSSYNGGHLHFFPHLLACLRERGLARVPVFGGGGGTILPADAETLEKAGVEKIYPPGWTLEAIAADLIARIAARAPNSFADGSEDLSDCAALGLALRRAEEQALADPAGGQEYAGAAPAKVVVVTGDGGSGKSTLIDELVARFLAAFPARKIAILANDPTIRDGTTLGAFLSDRVRMNHIYDERVWLRSLATGSPYAPVSPALPPLLRVLSGAGFDLLLVETPGSGQSGVDLGALHADLLLCVKSPEFGSALQLEKDQGLRDADLVILNKIDLEGAEAAYGEMRLTLEGLGKAQNLFPIIAKTARDPGTDRLFAVLCRDLGFAAPQPPNEPGDIFAAAKHNVLVPHRRRAYLAEIAARVRAYDRWVSEQLALVRQNPEDRARLDPRCARLLEEWPQRWQELSLQAAQGQKVEPLVETVNGLRLPRVALPDPQDRAEALRFLLEEGLPGQFPFVTGLYPYRPLHAAETTRQFAGLQGPEETNRRLHYLARGVARPRLSIAFDGITLYGDDSDDDPGSIGKIGEGGVAIDTWEDMKRVLAGFSPRDISTSMTINGPAAAILAMYFTAAMEIECERAENDQGAPLSATEAEALRRRTLSELRGTVQADILKEVQAQNECIFQPDFAMRLLGDVQQWFIDQGVKKFYSLSISGYHMGEAGASPVQELAFTLANGFTYVENFLGRGMAVDAFAPSLSFFFRVSHEAEWLAYGAVCRKIWAIAMRDVYDGAHRSQLFKFHTQTSGRALQAEEWDTLNPLRLSYHALLGLLANSNSLHIDSADEPMTTPGAKWVRQASLIPNYLREEAEAFVIQNLLSGSYAFRTLMREVQTQVLEEFDRLDQLGGVGPATERGYQRRCIAEHSAHYEQQRRRPSPEHPERPRRPIIGYNVHELPEEHGDLYPPVAELARPDPAVWERQLARVRDFKARHAQDAPQYLARLKQAALRGDNIFEELLRTVRHATLGQITRTLAEVGGRYRKMV
ncbi:methylmalonyl-CoA mutase family protein [Geoalkalibacter halelectricus]|uniref:methylmalonyl-CoA mutase family protein n=1 Tax=Geoalkalibacter halelectricus TaxID=2847045 RepID=UPI003D1D484C